MLRTCLATLFVALVPLAAAQADRPPPHRPPPEAFDACKTAKRGDACTVTLHDHTLTGTCDAPPDATALACRPDHPPGPPPEAIAACSGAKAGDACTIKHDDHTIAGQCSNEPEGTGELACRPDHPPPDAP